MYRYRVLGIAPYAGFSQYFLNEIRQREHMEADVYEATLEEAIDLVQRLDLSGYDVIVCRGRTAALVQEHVDIPVVAVELSGYDILRSMRLAKNTPCEKMAFISFLPIHESVRLICEILDEAMSIAIPPPPASAREMLEVVRRLHGEGVGLFIGDGTLNACARTAGVESILVTSGPESMKKAVDEAAYICQLKRRYVLYQSVVEHSDIPTALFHRDGTVIHSNVAPCLESALRGQIPLALSPGRQTAFQSVGGKPYKFTSEIHQVEGETYLCFHTFPLLEEVSAKGEVYCILPPETMLKNVLFVKSSTALRGLLERTGPVASARIPLIVYGDISAGKSAFAYALYAESIYRTRPCISVNCSRLDEKLLAKLFESENSPFLENNITILLEGLGRMPHGLQGLMSDYLEQTALVRRNKVITILDGDISQVFETLHDDLMAALSGYHIRIPSIRERVDDIPYICNTILEEINQELPVQIVGFTEGAMEALRNYPWEYGIKQLKMGIKHLAGITKSQLITEEHLKYLPPPAPKHDADGVRLDSGLDLTKSLDEITVDILRLVLEEENNNRAATARRLGISRSTLWKKLGQP